MGVMGVLADTVLHAGGKVIGVELEFFVEEEVQHKGITEFFVTKTMGERKQKIMELDDFFVAFPGGIGTLEDIAEVMTFAKIGQLNKPFCFLNIGGYYESLRALLAHMAREGFLEEYFLKGLVFAESIKKVESIFHLIENDKGTKYSQGEKTHIIGQDVS